MRCSLCTSSSVESFAAIPHDVSDRSIRLSIQHCLDCGLAWQYPRYRSDAESVDLHSARYDQQEKGTYYDPELRNGVSRSELAFVDAVRPARGTLLDIGAGDGTFIALAAEHGWTCTGVDPAARQRGDLPPDAAARFRLVRGTLDAIGSNERFDVITMWDVVEHLDDPEAVLRAAVDHLEPDGILIVETGNFQSANRITAGADWWAYAADHRWYFAPPTLRRLLHRAGLPHVALAKRMLRPGWRGSHAYAGPSRTTALKQLVRAPFAARSTLARHRSLKNAAVQWHDWAGLGIFALVASRQPLETRLQGEELLPM